MSTLQMKLHSARSHIFLSFRCFTLANERLYGGKEQHLVKKGIALYFMTSSCHQGSYSMQSYLFYHRLFAAVAHSFSLDFFHFF